MEWPPCRNSDWRRIDPAGAVRHHERGQNVANVGNRHGSVVSDYDSQFIGQSTTLAAVLLGVVSTSDATHSNRCGYDDAMALSATIINIGAYGTMQRF